jgi:hypothetical protein
MIAFGRGWWWPATFLGAFLVLIYLPTHHSGAGGVGGLVASVAALYALGLSVALPRLVRGSVLRRGGSRDPIVLLGRGADPFLSIGIRPRWRIAAIGVGMAVSLTGAIVSALLLDTADSTTYTHAVATLALGVNVALVAGAFVLAPGFLGWTLLLSLVDAAGSEPDQRVRIAARLARSIGFPVLLLVGVAAALLGDPMLTVLGFLLAAFTWTGTRLAVSHDAIARFLESHLVGDVARPATSHADADELVENLPGPMDGEAKVTLVETSGALVGAIGPLQLGGRDRFHRGERCSELMVPLSSLPLLRPTAPATVLLPALGRHGFAIVTAADGLGHVEASDLLETIQAWVAEDRRPPDRHQASR